MTSVRRFAGGATLVALVLVAASVRQRQGLVQHDGRVGDDRRGDHHRGGEHHRRSAIDRRSSPGTGGVTARRHLRRGVRGEQGRREDHLPQQLRLQRLGVDRRRRRRQGEGLLRRRCASTSTSSRASPRRNYPLIAANQAQFSSAGNFTEILKFSNSGAEYVALVNYGKVPIEALVTKDPTITDLAQLKGKTIGVKGDIPSSIVAMLAKAGLKRGTDYKEVLLDGFDPVAQLKLDIDALPVYKSNEPGQLDAAGVKYGLFDPADTDTPGTFGLIYTSKQFADDHPTAVAGFTRAALRGMEDAMADPAAAVAMSVSRSTRPATRTSSPSRARRSAGRRSRRSSRTARRPASRSG